MSIYAVVLNKHDKGAWERLQAKWPKPKHVMVSDSFAFVAPDQDIMTEDISEVVGMNNEYKVTGIVVRINFNALNGWNRAAVWEWLEDNQ